MRHALAHEIVGYCQLCEEPLTSRDVLETGQAKFCPDCYIDNVRPQWNDVSPRKTRNIAG
ncbi:hypothetical protein TPY_3246 [Sulfobacillus acidophilus TPY]|jgi:formylmethanofuran dehydrogenase subunit E|uniref:DksA C4-type domain-containing protein n=1 Tax=Sulfobacillus acidophilus (strain ATCC 700253 / DSM 10332 / NAL) TaxID=679936 RepID=G8TYY3_SULAD|nr:hypothetical protein TPY_3246 [Sulfobacillus acidophilus TPY]AEW05162.1 hypothetical protein Sulac_1665 [Sulfobacillus acidophilus DSM 10332]